MMKKTALYLRFPALLTVLCVGSYYVAAQVTTRLTQAATTPRSFIP